MADKNKLFLGTNKDTYIAADDAGNIIFQTEHGSRAVVDTEGMKVGVNGAAPAALGGGFETLSETITPAGSVGEAETIAISTGGTDSYGNSNYYSGYGDQNGNVRFSDTERVLRVLWLLSPDSDIFNNSAYFNKTDDGYGNINVSITDETPENISISNFNSYFNSDLSSTADSYGNAALSFDGHIDASGAYTGGGSFAALIANKNISRWTRPSSIPSGVDINGNRFIPIEVTWSTSDIAGFDAFAFGYKDINFVEARNDRETPFDLDFSAPERTEVSFTSNNIIMSGLPTEDPQVAGALWVYNGDTLRISDGNAGASMP